MVQRIGSAKSKSRWRRWLRRCGLVFAGLVLLLALLLTGIRLYLSDSRIRAIAERGMRNALGRSVRVGEVKWRLFESFRVDALVVEEKGEYGGGELASLGSLELRYDWLSFFRKRLEIEEIRAVEPVIRLARSREGNVNIADLPAISERAPGRAEETKKPHAGEAVEIPVMVKKFTLENGTLAFADRVEDISFSLDGIDAEWKVAGVVPDQGSASGTVSIATIEWRSGEFSWELPEVLVQLSATFDARIGSASLESLNLRMPGMTVRGTGFMEAAQDQIPEIDLALALDGDLGELRAGPAGLRETERSGSWRATLQMRGPVDRLNGTADFQGSDIRLSSRGEEWLHLGLLELREELTERNRSQVDVNGNIALAKLTAAGLEPISLVEIPHRVQLDLETGRALLPGASVVFSGGRAFAAGSLVRTSTGGLMSDVRLSGFGKLDKLARWVMPEMQDTALGDIGFRFQALGPVQSPVLTLEVESDLVQYTRNGEPDSRVFLRNFFSHVALEPQEDLAAEWSVEARYRPVLTRAGERPVDFGVVRVEGEGEFMPSDRKLRFERVEVRGQDFSVSGEIDLEFPARGQSFTESAIAIRPPLLRSGLLGFISEEAAIGL